MLARFMYAAVFRGAWLGVGEHLGACAYLGRKRRAEGVHECLAECVLR